MSGVRQREALRRDVPHSPILEMDDGHSRVGNVEGCPEKARRYAENVRKRSQSHSLMAEQGNPLA